MLSTCNMQYLTVKLISIQFYYSTISHKPIRTIVTGLTKELTRINKHYNCIFQLHFKWGGINYWLLLFTLSRSKRTDHVFKVHFCFWLFPLEGELTLFRMLGLGCGGERLEVGLILRLTFGLDYIWTEEILQSINEWSTFPLKMRISTLMWSDKCRLSRVLDGGMERIPARISAENFFSWTRRAPCTPLPRRLGAYSERSTWRSHSITLRQTLQ